MQRRATLAVALTLGASIAPVALVAQTARGVGPNPDTPRLLVAVFASADRASGVQAADAIRSRVANAVPVKQLYVIPKQDITNYLESSGYKPDSSLGPTDLKELAKLLRADEVLGGSVTRSGTGYKIEPRLMLARDVSFAQPLPTIEAGSPGDAARQIEHSLGDARKQLADNRLCENGLRDKQYDKAIAAARAAIVKYPNATIARTCLAMAYQAMNASPDSVLRVTDEIRRIDPKNSQALRVAFTAYKAKSDQENAIRALLGLWQLEPNNPTLQNSVIAELARLGKPEQALPIIDEILAQNPGDPQLLRQKWLVSLQLAANADSATRASAFGRAVTVGEEMIKLDTTLADSTFYARQIIAANVMTPPRGLEFASRAVQKYPNNAEFWVLKANAERKAGQTQMAAESMKRALAINANYPNAKLLLGQILIDLGQPDSAVTLARASIAAGDDPKIWGAFLLAPTQAAFKTAQAKDSAVYWQRALALAQESDKLSASPTSAFFVGIASFQVGIDALRQADAAQRAKKKDKPKVCSLAKQAQDMFIVTQTNMPKGGSVDPNVARTVLGAVTQYSPAADQMAKQNCK